MEGIQLYDATDNEKLLTEDIVLEEGDLKNQVLSFLDGKNESYKPYSDSFELYHYKEEQIDDSLNPGVSDLWTNYNDLGEDVYLVVLDRDSRKYKTVGIKDRGNKTVVVKSIEEVDEKIRSVASQYKYKEDKQFQEYPYTMETGSEKFRTFYFGVNSLFELEVKTNFEIETLDIEQTIDSSKVLGQTDGTIARSKREAVVVLGSKWAVASEQDKDEKNVTKEDSLINGAYLYLLINSTIEIPLQIKIFDDEVAK